jgi:hypothetical protein
MLEMSFAFVHQIGFVLDERTEPGESRENNDPRAQRRKRPSLKFVRSTDAKNPPIDRKSAHQAR